MKSTFMGLELAKRGLSAHQKALEVTGHNISNADNKNYSRQRVVMESADPIYMPAFNRASGPGMLGQGVIVSQVERMRSNFIEDRVNLETNSFQYWQTKHDYLYQVQVVFNEPSDNSLRTRFDKFWNSWQELSKYPQEGAVRNVLIETGNSLTSELRHVHSKLHELQKQANILVKDRVDKINQLAVQIRDINQAILKAENLEDNPNDLLDRRDKMINDLAKMVNIQVSRNDKDEMMIFIGSENLIQGSKVQPLRLDGDPRNDGFYKVSWQTSQEVPAILGGELKGLLEIRDTILRRNINEIDSMTLNMASLINEIHRDGFGLNERTNINFFTIQSLAEDIAGNWDADGDGQADRSALFKISGVNALQQDAEIGISGTLTLAKNDAKSTPVFIEYQATDKIKDVIHKINISGAGVVAYLNHHQQLAFRSKLADDHHQNNFMIRHIEDSGQFLVGLAGVLRNSGAAGAYDWQRVQEVNKLQGGPIHYELTPHFHPSQHISVNDSIIRNPDNIAAAKGKDIGGTGDPNKTNGKGDGSNALMLSSIRGDKSIMIEANASFDDFLTGIIARSGAESAESRDHADNKEKLLDNLLKLRQSISGVNIDEEMANMIQFQNSYNASARFISTLNQMMDTILKLGS